MAEPRVIDLGLPVETERLRIRHLVAEDLPALLAIESRPEVARWLYWEPRTEAEVHAGLERRMARAREAPETGVTFGAEILATGELVGHVSLTVGPHRQGEIGFIFHPDRQGRGYATEAAAAVLRIGFEAYELHRVCGRLEPRNGASARVLAKLGMRLEGVLRENEWVKGEWQSEAIYAVLEREWRFQRLSVSVIS
jgi:RimJ/RimL family protein N-acetyltransferase